MKNNNNKNKKSKINSNNKNNKNSNIHNNNTINNNNKNNNYSNNKKKINVFRSLLLKRIKKQFLIIILISRIHNKLEYSKTDKKIILILI